jgi:hypothetical protein
VVGSPLFQPYKTMTKKNKVRQHAIANSFEKHLRSLDALLDALGADTLHNACQKVDKLQNEIKKEKLKSEEYLQLTQTNDHGEAKQRVRALMNKAGATKVALIALIEKYNLDASFLRGIGDMWDKQGEGRDQLKVFASMEKKLEHQRRIVTEAYTYMLELVEQKAAEANYTWEQTLEVITVWHDEMKERFHELTALEFWQEYKGNMLNLNLKLNQEEKTVNLAEAKTYCEEFYPALLLTQTFANPEDLGTVSIYTMNVWGEIHSKALGRTNPEEKRNELYELARTVMKTAIFRKAIQAEGIEGDEAHPTTERYSLIEQLITLDEFSPYGKNLSINENTELDDILNEFISLTFQV